jgi:phage shock protein C
MQRQLLRSETNKVIGGVCGGLGDYFDVDPTLVRIIAVLLFFASGFGLLAYIAGWIIIPKARESEQGVGEAPAAADKQYGSWNRYLPGFILIAIGIFLLIRENIYWFDWGEFWPVMLIGLGLVLIFRKKGRHRLNEDNPVEVVSGPHSKTQNGESAS